MPPDRNALVICYSPPDRRWVDRLRVLLRPYQRGGRLEVWADPPGLRVRGVRRHDLGRARAVALLVSRDFLGSPVILDEELPAVRQAARAGGLAVLCVPVGAGGTDLGALRDWPWVREHRRPLEGLPRAVEQNAALVAVARRLALAAGAGRDESRAAPTHPRAGRPRPAPIGTAEGPAGRLHGVPRAPPHFVSRLADLERLKHAILHGGSTAAVVIPAGAGPGASGHAGLGKTVLAIALTHDAEIRRAVPDGVYWVALGPEAPLASLQERLARTVSPGCRGVADVADGRHLLHQFLGSRRCLLVLDDVWSCEQLEAFDVVGTAARLLVTTEDQEVAAGLGAEEHGVEPLDDGLARRLLAEWAGADRTGLPDRARELIAACRNLPLALALAGARIAEGVPWDEVVAALRAAGQEFLDHPHSAVWSAMRASVDALGPGEGVRYLELGVFPDTVPVPETVVCRLWERTGNLGVQECRFLLERLERRALLELDADGAVLLHSLQRDFLRLAAEDLPAVHADVIEACRPGGGGDTLPSWSDLPASEEYLWRHLAHHLLGAGRDEELRALLLDGAWLRGKLEATDVNAALGDYGTLDADPLAGRVGAALRLSAPVIARDRTQLMSQLHGRLGADEVPGIRSFLDRGRRAQREPWLRPLTASLMRPGERRRIAGHADWVRAVAISPDGARAVSASGDRALKVWDVATGALLWTLGGHTGPVFAVALTPDGTQMVSASSDRTLRVWDMATGAHAFSLIGPPGGVSSVTVTADGRRVVSASWDGVIKVWDLWTGAEVWTLTGHSGLIASVAVALDARQAVSASSDRTLKVWDLSAGTQVRTLVGHGRAVASVAITPDGARAVSASGDHSLKVWDLGTGAELGTLAGHTAAVSSVAITPDGRRAVSASWDGTLRVWDLAAATEVCALAGHAAAVSLVAIMPDGRHAISASLDHTLRVWDLDAGRAVTTFAEDVSISCCAVGPDSATIVAGGASGGVHLLRLERPADGESRRGGPAAPGRLDSREEGSQ